MFEDVLQHAEKEDKGEEEEKEGNKKEEVEKDESNSSQTEKEDKTEPDTIKMENKPEPVTVTLNEEPLDHSEMCEDRVETPEASFSMDEGKEAQSVDCSEGEMEGKQEIAPMDAEDDFLTLPPSCILSPLSKSVEAVVTPLVYWPGFRYFK